MCGQLHFTLFLIFSNGADISGLVRLDGFTEDMALKCNI